LPGIPSAARIPFPIKATLNYKGRDNDKRLRTTPRHRALPFPLRADLLSLLITPETTPTYETHS